MQIIEPDYQVYGDKNYLAHNLKGATIEDDRRFFSQRIPAFGVIDFGVMSANSVKSYTPINDGIQSPISIENMDFYRQKLGNKPIKVSSWYRPTRVNSIVKGSKWSRHQYGDAVDFVAFHLTSRQIATKLEPFHDNRGYCCYAKFTHVDWRGRKARW